MVDSILDKVLSTKHAEEISHFAPQEILTRVLLPLPSRERDIILRRFGMQGKTTATLEEIGKELEVTRERVRQIEHGAIKKVRENPASSSSMATVEHVIQQYLEEAGGALSDDDLYERLTAGRDQPNDTRLILRFFLDELIPNRFQRINENENFHNGWALRFSSIDELKSRISLLEEIIEAQKVPFDFSTIARLYREKKSGETISDEQLHALLGLSAKIQQNAFGEWGLASWATIHPRRMKDKIYLVLKRHGKPIHFNEITRLINEAGFDQKVAYAPTVHNELIMDKRFVLVGRGIYALAEWGFKPGIVSDVIADVLKNEGAPLSRESIVQKVFEQRFVGKATVHLALMNREKFTKLPDGRYTIRE